MKKVKKEALRKISKSFVREKDNIEIALKYKVNESREKRIENGQ